MSEVFDPYLEWMGIPPSDQPPNYYRLLRIHPFEESREVIQAAVQSQTAWLETLRFGHRGAHAARLLSRVTKAGKCLLDADSKAAYDSLLLMKFGPTASKGATGEESGLVVGRRRAATSKQPPFPSYGTDSLVSTLRIRWLAAALFGGAQAMGLVCLWLIVLLLVRQGQSPQRSPRELASQDIPNGVPDADAALGESSSGENHRAGQEEGSVPGSPLPEDAAATDPSESSGSPASGGRAQLPSPITATNLPGDRGKVSSAVDAAGGFHGMSAGLPTSSGTADRNAPEGGDASRPKSSTVQNERNPGERPLGESSNRTEDSIDLGEGRSLRLRDFAIPQQAITHARTFGITVDRVSELDELDEAYLVIDGQRHLSGPCVAYLERQIKLVATYSRGERHGVTVLCNAEGQPWYWGEYVDGRRQGNCCLLQNGEPTVVCECASGRLVRLHLISDRKVRASFPGLEPALENDEATRSLSEMSDAESELEEIEDVFAERIHAHFQKEVRKGMASRSQPKPPTGRTAARPPQSKTARENAAAATRAARARMSNRINQRGSSQQGRMYDSLQRSWGR